MCTIFKSYYVMLVTTASSVLSGYSVPTYSWIEHLLNIQLSAFDTTTTLYCQTSKVRLAWMRLYCYLLLLYHG